MTWIEAANTRPTLIERIRSLLVADNYISFVELAQLDGFRGGQSLLLDAPGTENIVLWPGVSAEAETALLLLLRAGKAHFEPASLLTYLCDGATPALPGKHGAPRPMPLAKQCRRYKTPHWLPMTLARGRGTVSPHNREGA